MCVRYCPFRRCGGWDENSVARAPLVSTGKAALSSKAALLKLGWWRKLQPSCWPAGFLMVEVTEIGESAYMAACTESQIDYMCYTDSVNPDLDGWRASDRSFAAVASQRHSLTAYTFVIWVRFTLDECWDTKEIHGSSSEATVFYALCSLDLCTCDIDTCDISISHRLSFS